MTDEKNPISDDQELNELKDEAQDNGDNGEGCDCGDCKECNEKTPGYITAVAPSSSSVLNPELAAMTPMVPSLDTDAAKTERFMPCQVRVYTSGDDKPSSDVLVGNTDTNTYSIKVQLPGAGNRVDTPYGASGSARISAKLYETLKTNPHECASLNVDQGQASYFRGQVRVDPTNETCLVFQLSGVTAVKPYGTAYGTTFKLDCNTSAGFELRSVIALATFREKQAVESN